MFLHNKKYISLTLWRREKINKKKKTNRFLLEIFIMFMHRTSRNKISTIRTKLSRAYLKPVIAENKLPKELF